MSTATMAYTPGVLPVYIFPFTPVEYFGTANLHEFQVLMYRPLYWYGHDGEPEVDHDLSLAEPPEWSADGLTVTITLKPWWWSNGEPVCADNVMLWMHLLQECKADFGGYVPGYFPDNLTSFRKVAENQVSFTFDRVYSKMWVLMNQLSSITPLPRAWDRTADGPADCTHDPSSARAVWSYLRDQNADRRNWASNPLWGVVNGPWRLETCTLDGVTGEVTFVPNECYSGPNRPRLDRFRQVTTASNDAEYETLASDPGAIQVGFLPFDRVVEPTVDPTKGGPNPLDEHYTLVPHIAFKINYFPMNFNNPTVAGRIIGQLYFRQALQSVLDQDAAISEVYKGYGYPTYGPVPMLPDSELISPAHRQNRYPFDIDRARRYLTDNGWDVGTTPAVCVDPDRAGDGIPAGTELRFLLRYTEGYPGLTWMMAKLRDDAARAGIALDLEEVDASVIVVEDTTCTPGPDSPCLWQFSNWNGGWIYGPGFHPTGEFLYQSGSGVNFGSYADPRADELIARSVTSDDPADFHAYQDYISEQVPVVWVPNFPVRLLEVARDLRGVEPINPYGLLTPENWYYAEQED
ncbi:ABC transporter substrate-binding protein [Longispora urticae]